MLSFKFLSALSLLVLCSASEEKHKLQFKNGKFKILQLTDIHFGEGFKHNDQNYQLVKKLIEWEKPDFVAVTGDVVSGYAWDGHTQGWYKENYEVFMKAMNETEAWWALTAGNHDT